MNTIKRTGPVWDWIGQQGGISSVVWDESSQGCFVTTPHGQKRAADIARAISVKLPIVETVIRKWEAIVAYSQAEGRGGVSGVIRSIGEDYDIHFTNGSVEFLSHIVMNINTQFGIIPPVKALEVAFVMRMLQT